jgi:hypothetical protein
MPLVVGTILWVVVGTAVVGVAAWLVDKSAASRKSRRD